MYDGHCRILYPCPNTETLCYKDKDNDKDNLLLQTI